MRNAESTKGMPDPSGAAALEAWSTPTIKRLRAAAAESNPGISIFDGALEAIGS